MTRPSSSSSSGSRYNLGLNPPYQINYRSKRAGKHISASKRRITFQFGFSSAAAIKSGRTEVECRGEEHEVVLIWSHMTGKRHVYMDGREIHMSKAARGNTRFEYSWGLGSHVLKIIANGTPQQYQKQFDLELDGMSYFDFAKIYELGGRSNSGVSEGRSASPAVGYSYRGLGYDERDDDLVDDVQPPMPEVEVKSVDLFDFDAQPSVVSPMTNFSSVPSLVDSSASSNSNSSFDEFAPVDISHQRSYDSISNEILSGYSITAAPAAKDTPSTCTALVPVSEEGVDAITKSMKSIVNLDDITTGPVKPLAAPVGTMNKQKSLQSWALVGREPTLAELRTQSPTVSTNVMKQQPVQQMYQQPSPQAMYQQAPAYGYNYNYGAPNNAGYARAY